MQKSRGVTTRREDSSGVRRGWRRLRPQPRRTTGMTRRPQKKMVRRDCSRTATAAWAAVSGGGSPPSHVPSVPAGSDLPPSGTRRAATGASQNTPGFLEQNSRAVVRGQEKGKRRAGAWRGPRDGPGGPHTAMGTSSDLHLGIGRQSCWCSFLKKVTVSSGAHGAGKVLPLCWALKTEGTPRWASRGLGMNEAGMEPKEGGGRGGAGHCRSDSANGRWGWVLRVL